MPRNERGDARQEIHRINPHVRDYRNVSIRLRFGLLLPDSTGAASSVHPTNPDAFTGVRENVTLLLANQHCLHERQGLHASDCPPRLYDGGHIPDLHDVVPDLAYM